MNKTVQTYCQLLSSLNQMDDIKHKRLRPVDVGTLCNVFPLCFAYAYVCLLPELNTYFHTELLADLMNMFFVDNIKSK